MSLPVRPVKHDGDPDTPMTLKCAWCGRIIAFAESEVYVQRATSSYVCYDHAHRDCRTCRFSARHPTMGYWLCRQPDVPGMRRDQKDWADGIVGLNAAAVSGREPGLPRRPDLAPCAGYRLWEPRGRAVNGV